MEGTKSKVYVLVCPISNEVRYVGQTITDLAARLSGHISETGVSEKNQWIQYLASENKSPQIVLLEVTDTTMGNSVEQMWIHLFKSRGFRLLNAEIFIPNHYNNKANKTEISAEDYKNWRALARYGDLSKIGRKLKYTSGRVKMIIESRKGTPEEIKVISDYYNAQKLYRSQH